MSEMIDAVDWMNDLETGLALAEIDSGRIVFSNGRFDTWFPVAEGGNDLWSRFSDIDRDRMNERFQRGRSFAFEAERKIGARDVFLVVHLHPLGQPASTVVVEAQNVSKQREAEYLLDSYSRMAEKNARQLKRERERVEKLLLNLMPKTVYDEMRDLGTVTPQRYDSASVLMLDFVGFTEMAISQDPGALIGELNDIFSAFDRIVEMYNCERIKTIGDGYVAVSGMPERTPDHAANLAKVALRLRRYIDKRNTTHSTTWLCRIGVATGPAIGSLVGVQKYVYDIFGPAVNLAARLESAAAPMEILLSPATREAIQDDFVLAEHGTVCLKGFGEMTPAVLIDEADNRS